MGSELKRRLLCARQGGRRRAEEAKSTREPSGESCRDRVAGADMFPPHPSFFHRRSEQGHSLGFLLVKRLGRRVGRGELGKDRGL